MKNLAGVGVLREERDVNIPHHQVFHHEEGGVGRIEDSG